jgi:hypothetical protein
MNRALGKLLGLIILFSLSAVAKVPKDFTDKDLDQILKTSLSKKTQGLIYVWSPHMPLSIRGVREAERIAKEKKLKLIILLDPYSNLSAAQQISRKEKFPETYLARLESRKLLRKEMTVHFPSLIVFNKGGLAGEMRGGYDNPQRLADYLDKELSRIRGPASILPSNPLKGIFATQFAWSQEPSKSDKKQQSENSSDEICRFAPFGVIKRTAPLRATSYFFRTFPKSAYVSYAGMGTGAEDGDTHNFILDLKARKEIELEGQYDPVPICEDIMTVPDGTNMKFISIKKLLAGLPNPEIKTIAFGGVYQSVTACPRGGKGLVKMITDEDGASMATFKVDTTIFPPTIDVVEAPKAVCTNVDLKFPMLSKDGTEISGRDQKDGTSKVWKFEKDGTCKEVFNFGSLIAGDSKDAKLMVGKTDFSFDGKKLVFHVRSDVDDGNYFDRASSSMAMNIYMYDREKKTLSKLTNNYDRNSYYPVFKEDGSVVYLDMTHQGQISFIWLNPDKSPSTPVDTDFNEETQREKFHRYQSLMAIGRTWYEYCAHQREPLQADAAVLTALSLDENECQDLVKQEWPKLKSAVISKSATDKSYRGIHYGNASLAKLDTNELTSFCPEDPHKTKEIEVLGNLDDTVIQTAQGIIEGKCLVCHHDKPIGEPEAMSQQTELVKKMMWRIFEAPPEQRMPLGGSLTSHEQSLLSEYLKAYLEKKIKASPAPTTGSGQQVVQQHSGVHRTRLIRARRPKDLPPLDEAP